MKRIFAGDRLNAIMVRLKMPEGEAIEHALVTRSLGVGAAQGRSSATSTSASSCSNTTTSPTTSAR